MEELSVFLRKEEGKQQKELKAKGFIPAVLYGPEFKSSSLQIAAKEFAKIFHQVGENTLFTLRIDGRKEKPMVLVHEVQRNPISGDVVHVDFFQPKLTQKIEAKIPVVLEGEAPAVKESGGTLIKNIQEITVKALPQNLPKEITISVASLATLEAKVFVKDIAVDQGVEVINDPEEIIAQVAPPEKVEEELAKPVEEKVEEVAKVEKQKKEKEEKIEEDEG